MSFVDRQTTPWKHKEAFVNNIKLHYVEAEPARRPEISSFVNNKGSDEPPLVLLLHGFPEFWYSWRHQLHFLSKEGYRVVAPDLRGYNLSQKPSTGYNINTLSDDIQQLILHLVKRVPLTKQQRLHSETTSPVFLVGHDWGAAIAFAVAARFPDLIQKLVIMNGPNLMQVYSKPLSWQQWFRFYYVALFQCPLLPEFLLGVNHSWLSSRIIKNTAVVDCFDETTCDVFRNAMSQKGAHWCMLAYYRNMQTPQESRQHGKIKAPLLILWGEQDHALTPEVVGDAEEWTQDGDVEFVSIPNCGHWTQQEQPNEVNRHLLRFLSKK